MAADYSTNGPPCQGLFIFHPWRYFPAAPFIIANLAGVVKRYFSLDVGAGVWYTVSGEVHCASRTYLNRIYPYHTYTPLSNFIFVKHFSEVSSTLPL